MTVPSKQQSGTATPSLKASSASAVTLLEANPSRSGATIFNEGAATLTLHLGLGASATVYTLVMAAGSYYEVPFGYTGVITGFWSAAGAGNNARIVELTA